MSQEDVHDPAINISANKVYFGILAVFFTVFMMAITGIGGWALYTLNQINAQIPVLISRIDSMEIRMSDRYKGTDAVKDWSMQGKVDNAQDARLDRYAEDIREIREKLK